MKDRKISVTICAGTTCYITGGSHYMLLKDMVPQEIHDALDIQGATCLGHCKNPDEGRFPCLIIEGKNYFALAPDEVVTVIREIYQLKTTEEKNDKRQ